MTSKFREVQIGPFKAIEGPADEVKHLMPTQSFKTKMVRLSKSHSLVIDGTTVIRVDREKAMVTVHCERCHHHWKIPRTAPLVVFAPEQVSLEILKDKEGEE